MAVTRPWNRTFGQFLANGSTPKTATGNNTMTITPVGAQNLTSLRLRTDIELYVVAQATGTNPINLAFIDETIMAVGSIAYLSGAVTLSNTPLTDANLPSGIALGHSWGQWEYLYPQVDYVNLNSPELMIVTWRPRDKTIDTQYRRAVVAPNGIDLWMPWEIQDGSGLINTTTSGVTYNLGARFAQSWLYERKS